jgi:DNA-binding beta-propeller fold protein YncE
MGRSRWIFALGAVGVFGGCYGSRWDDPTPVGSLQHAHGGHDSGLSFQGSNDAGPEASVSTSSILPAFGPTTTAAAPPPPISGGTLLVTTDGSFAVAADPDRDLVYGVDLGRRALAWTFALHPGDEPGRVAEDGAGRVHVALRHGGALVTLDEKTGQLVARRGVCPAPRGVAWESSTDRVWVACATGELVAFPSAGGGAVARYTVERDLRDVVLSGGQMALTTFRSAELLRVTSGAVTRRDDAPALGSFVGSFAAHVAWRARAMPGGRVVVIHQVESTLAVPTHQPNAYGGCGMLPIPPPDHMPLAGDASAPACASEQLQNFVNAGCDERPGAVASAITVFDADGTVVANRLFPGSLPVDVAVSPDGSRLAVAAPGDAFTTGLGTLLLLTPCGDFARAPMQVGSTGREQPIAVAFDPAGDLLTQTREPAALSIRWARQAGVTSIPLSAVSREDSGHDLFHTQAGAMVACASCHPEGGDDGHVFLLDGAPRRTPSLRGTIAGTAPYHWLGDQATLDALIDDVYSTRMNGAHLGDVQKAALERWVQALPAPPPPSTVDVLAAERGRTLFVDPKVGCATCHAGSKMTNDLSMDVGTGGAFQVPSLLGVGWRTPLMHDGCAATIADRFGKCSTPGHGDLTGLGQGDLADLTSYLETL